MLLHEPERSSRNRQSPIVYAAWGVHLLTATGAVMGLMAIIAIARQDWLRAFAWMGVTIVIDSVDGMCARACRVKEVLPHFDGALLDNIVDYFTYVIVPASFLYETHSVPTGFNLASAMLITLASAYQFCQMDAKTKDHCFTGFPSYWNVTAFYLFMLGWPEWVNLGIIVVLAIGVFVPVKYLYPSRTRLLRPLTIVLTILWGAVVFAAMLRYPDAHRPLMYVSLAYIAYYFAMSAFLTARGLPHRDDDPSCTTPADNSCPH
jgi:phosphatidylcholine synthase